jgi:hypothetical protein
MSVEDRQTTQIVGAVAKLLLLLCGRSPQTPQLKPFSILSKNIPIDGG